MVDSKVKKQVRDLYHRALKEDDNQNHEEAMKLIDQAIALMPSDTALWSARAQFRYDKKDYADAEVDAESAIERDEKNLHAWGLLGQIKAHTGHFEEAAACYKKSLQLSEDKGLYTLLAAVEYEFDLPSAIRHARKALKLDPSWDEAQKILDAAQDELKKREK